VDDEDPDAVWLKTYYFDEDGDGFVMLLGRFSLVICQRAYVRNAQNCDDTDELRQTLEYLASCDDM